VKTWLGLDVHEDAPQLPDALARRLFRAEEHEHAYRDQWGNWEFGLCEAFRAGRLWEPDVDRWLVERRRELGLDAASLWPEGRPFALSLTHDVDLIADAVTPRQAVRSMRTSLLGASSSGRDRLVRLARPGVRGARAVYHGVSPAPRADALEHCVELEREHGVTASYFFTAYAGSEGHRYDCVYGFDDPCRFRGERTDVAGVIRTLHGEGFDIGLHGSYNSALVPGRLAQEKAALEEATGLRIETTRQHFVHWDAGSTPRFQAEAGFRADSTLGFNRSIGLRAGTSLPFRWFDLARGEALDLVQAPLLVHDGALLRADALELGAELAHVVLREFLDRIAEVGGAAVLVFHPNNLARRDYLDLFRATIEYGLERGAWFASVRDLDRWWRGREAAVQP
jgi:peptidoglycan/xylan/chitin deacetylase (PgdA/CDA1 family)